MAFGPCEQCGCLQPQYYGPCPTCAGIFAKPRFDIETQDLIRRLKENLIRDSRPLGRELEKIWDENASKFYET